MEKLTIYFDMDGTLADLYSIANWKEKLDANDATPFREARALINLSALSRKLNQLQQREYRIGIISWLPKRSTPEFDKVAADAKIWWLRRHLKSVHFDEYHFLPYGTKKSSVAQTLRGYLFDDNFEVRIEWGHSGDHRSAFPESQIMRILSTLLAQLDWRGLNPRRL